MSYLPQGHTNTANLLAFFVVDEDGWLVDPSEIGFRIFDETGTQTFPAVVGNYEDVRSNDGRLGRGRYFAYDDANARGWQVPAAAIAGGWRIEWRWKIESSDAYSTWSEDFDVVASYDSGAGTGFRGVGYRTYTSPARIRDEGISATQLSDPRMEQLILDAQAYIERETRNLFRPVYDTIRVDGKGAGRMFLGLPIIGADAVLPNSSSEATRDALAVAFNRIDYSHLFTPKPDYRRKPSISYRSEVDVFAGTSPLARGYFRPGRQNQTVRAVWGFVESDGTTPRLIANAALRLVYGTATALDPNAVSVAGPLKSRTVDRHSESWAEAASGNLKRALAVSKEVEEALMLYKAPIAMSAPSPVAKGLTFRV